MLMFTGIITHTGKLKKKEKQLFTFSASGDLLKKLRKGESIAVNGCCLTIINVSHSTFDVEIMPETQKKTMIQTLRAGQIVNFELPVSAITLLSGHIAQGHIDGVGKIAKIQKEGNSQILTVIIPKDLRRYIVAKGSITLNGISLTVIDAENDYCTVGIIPYTWKNTMLNKIKVGNLVNIEVDIIAKYIWKQKI